jgi:NitT/TauT family transport system substrate-binding protein
MVASHRIALVASLAGLVLGWGSAGLAAERQLTKMTFAASSPILAGLCNVTAGKYLGYYAEEGIDAEFMHTAGVSELIGGLNVGHMQLGMLVPDPILSGAAEGKDFRLLFVYALNRGISNQIAVRPDSPIRGVRDLRGKKIGVFSLGHSSYFYARQVLRLEGMDPDRDAEYIAVGGGGGPVGHALETGRVDAISSFDFSLVQIESLGFKLRILPQPPSIERMAAGIALGVGREYFAANKRLIGGFLRALAKGTVWYLTNPEACARIHWKVVPAARPKGVAEDVAMRDAVRQVAVRAPLFRKDRGTIPKFGAFSPPDWEAYVKYLGLDGKVDAAKLYTNELIDAANDFDERKIADEAKAFDPNRLR